MFNLPFTQIILIALALYCLMWPVLAYNRLVGNRNRCTEAWSNIDTELKRRHDLIPNLVATVKGYAAHEATLLTEITRLREAAEAERQAPGSDSAAENQLIQALAPLMVRLEAYPELKADAHFLKLQRELTLTEDRIQAARRFFNGNVRENNNAVESFPSSLIAHWFKFTLRGYYEIEDFRIRENPSVEITPRT